MARKRIAANTMRVQPRMNIESEQKSRATPPARNKSVMMMSFTDLVFLILTVSIFFCFKSYPYNNIMWIHCRITQ